MRTGAKDRGPYPTGPALRGWGPISGGPHFRGAPFRGLAPRDRRSRGSEIPHFRLCPPRSSIAGFGNGAPWGFGNTPFPSEMGPLGGSDMGYFLGAPWGPLASRAISVCTKSVYILNEPPEPSRTLRMGSRGLGNLDRGFIEWLVGFTDGDGTFSMSKYTGKNHYTFTFKLAQSKYNVRILYYIKSKLGYGSVTNMGKNCVQYRIRDKRVLCNVIIPIFDSYSLHTRKAWDYSLFKRALYSDNESFVDQLISSKTLNVNDIYSLRGVAYNLLSENTAPVSLSETGPLWRPFSKAWLVGFVEAEGSFFITQKEANRYVHSFGLTQKGENQLLEQIRCLFGISAKLKPNKSGAWSVETSNSRCIEYIIEYFKSARAGARGASGNQFKGVKSVEFRIWSRTYYKFKGNSPQLKRVQELLNRIRNRHKIIPDNLKLL